MKKIIICGSISASQEIVTAQRELEERGFEVEIPHGVKKFIANNFEHVPVEERHEDKKKYDLIRKYYEEMKMYDNVLIVNPEKKGIQGYIGGNTFLEMGFAHVLNKKLYVLNPLPDISYLSELEAMDPVVLNGNLSLIGV